MALIFYNLIFSAAAGFWGLTLYEMSQQRRAQRRLTQREEAVDKKSLVDYTFRPIFTSYSHLFKKIHLEYYRRFLRRKFVQGAVARKYNEEIFWAFQIFMGFLFVALYYGLAAYCRFLGLAIPTPFWLMVMVFAAGLGYPLLWLHSLTKKRLGEIVRLFPEFVTNLALAVEAGMDFFSAMGRYAKNFEQNPLGRELQTVITEVQLGASREEALRHLAGRLQIRPVSAFVSVMVQTTRLGTSVGQVLRVQAEQLRRERFEAAERAGVKASQKILFPLVFFIMPAVFLLIFGPLIVKLLTGGIEALFL
ncbi:MAG: type II secretion system F family protein [Deltaproteobacteria bacterium]|nr:type II secretion system F family protein [Deltaproteobacteria bacterium]MBI4224182.1 type II secretion system F family protein [Deltaproteobacteria bacterium]